MGRGPVVGDLRVQRIERSDGGWSFTIVWADGAVHAEADGFLCGYEGSGTQRTYAYLLVDHPRWLDRACLPLGSVTLRDLERYMGLVGADVRMPLGEPWRAGKRPYGRSALSAAAACLKGFYLHQTSLGVNAGLGNPNRAGAKAKHPWRVEHGTVTGGLIRRVSPAMIHSYFEYITGEYPGRPGHQMLLVQLHGERAGQPWAPDAARRMLAPAGRRAGIGVIKPHAFRHSFAAAVLDAANGNLLIARDAGGWASATTVDEVYGHADVHDPAFDAALRAAWGETR